MNIADFLELFDGRDPKTEVIMLVEGIPGDTWDVSVYEDTTQGEPKPLVFFAKKDNNWKNTLS